MPSLGLCTMSQGSRSPFVEIAYAADVNRFEDEEFEQLARKNCNEDPETRSKIIEELRTMIYRRGQCNPRRMDDAYLLRFLRCRRFIPALAHKLMVRYEQFRAANPHLYDCDAFGLQKVKHVYGGVLPESLKHGRISLMKFGKWDTDLNVIDDLVRCALIMDEIAAMQPKLQILGITIIVDLEGLGFRHVRTLTPAVAGQVVALMGVSFPLLMHGLHIVNYGVFLNYFFYFFKQFIPSAVWSRLYFHRDLSSLHTHIEPQYLPEEYGGTCGESHKCENWLPIIDKYKDDFIVKELRELGFRVNS